MKRSVWPTALVLLVPLSWVATAPGQTGGLRPVPIPAEPAALGRPVPPRVVRTVPPIEVVPVSYTAEKPRPIAVATGTTEPVWTRSAAADASDLGTGSEFAIDRPATTMRTLIVPAGARITGDDPIPGPKTPTLPAPGLLLTTPPGKLPGTIYPGTAGTGPAVSSPTLSGMTIPGPIVPGPAIPGTVVSGPAFEGPNGVPPKGLLANIWPNGPCEVPLPGVPCDTGACQPCPPCQPCPTECPPCTTTTNAPPSGLAAEAKERDCCWYDPGHRQWYLQGEYLLWWANGYDVPPLATTGPFGSPNPFVGALGDPGTQILSPDTIDHGAMSGARFTLGYWMHCEKALEVSGFFLAPNDESLLFRGTQFPVLTRPFFSLNRNAQVVQFVSLPGVACGDLTIDSTMDFWGLEANYRCNWCCGDCSHKPGSNYRLDFLAGFRFLNLEESLTIREDILGVGTNEPPGFAGQQLQITVLDSFATRNRFYGGQVGFDAEWRKGRWVLGTRAKLGIGSTQQQIDIAGSQRIASLNTGAVVTGQGGLLALNSNIGTHTSDRFSIVPEVNVTAGFHLLDHVKVYAGYNFLYWSNVVRPGDQIDLTVDTSRIPFLPNSQPIDRTPQAVVRPAVPFKTSDFWTQGLLLGLEVRY